MISNKRSGLHPPRYPPGTMPDMEITVLRVSRARREAKSNLSRLREWMMKRDSSYHPGYTTGKRSGNG
jgi:hypothetical protein